MVEEAVKKRRMSTGLVSGVPHGWCSFDESLYKMGLSDDLHTPPCRSAGWARVTLALAGGGGMHQGRDKDQIRYCTRPKVQSSGGDTTYLKE